jgi:hypothetical protein
MSIHKVVEALNAAFAADPCAIHALIVNRVPCNQALADDPFVQVDCPPVLREGLFQVGAIGLINGVLAAIGLPLAATMFSDEKDDDGRSRLLGFTVYKPEAVVTEGEAKSHVNPPVAKQNFPQYVKDCCGYIFRADAPDRIFSLPREGGEYLQDDPEWHWEQWADRDPLTEFEIGEIINCTIMAEEKATSDVMVQSPDDWVTQDRVYRRVGIDQFRWLQAYNGQYTEWQEADAYPLASGLHGRVDFGGDTFEVRCRRQDLPVVNARIPVILYWYDGAIVGRYADSPVTDPSFVPIHSDGNGGWFIERSTNADDEIEDLVIDCTGIALDDGFEMLAEDDDGDDLDF